MPAVKVEPKEQVGAVIAVGHYLILPIYLARQTVCWGIGQLRMGAKPGPADGNATANGFTLVEGFTLGDKEQIITPGRGEFQHLSTLHADGGRGPIVIDA